MKKEILLYSALYSYTASQFINELEANKDKEIVIRLNTPGGVVYDAYGMFAKLKEHKGKKTIKVDGMAASGGAFFLCYADSAECLDVSEFLFHRAAYGSWIENNKDYFTEEMKTALIKMNSNLRAAMEGKFTAEKWQEVTGVSLDDLFSLENRIDVRLDANQALKLGLVNKITTITPEKKAEIEALSEMTAAAAFSVTTTPIQATNTNTHTMTLEQLKKEHPEAYAQAVQSGVAQERERVEALVVFAHIDIEAVKTAITDGKAFTPKEMAEFALKAAPKAESADDQIQALEKGNAPDVTQQNADNNKTAAEANSAEFEKNVFALIGLKAN